MLEVLSSHFSVHNRELLARQEYATLKQKDGEDFSTFYTRFQSCIFYFNKTEEDKTHDLLDKLNYTLYREVNDGRSYESLSALVERCRLKEKILHGRTLRKGDRIAKSSSRQIKPLSSSYVKVSRPTNNKGAKAQYSEPFPEKWRRGKLSVANRNELRKRDACFDYRKPGHLANNPSCEVSI